jgi:hypothetical protein
LERELLPIALSVEAGAYINAIRTSLDILAMALVRRHGLAIPENRVSFPIADSEEAFLKKGGAPLLQQLPTDDRAKLLLLKLSRGQCRALGAAPPRYRSQTPPPARRSNPSHPPFHGRIAQARFTANLSKPAPRLCSA